MHKSIGRIVIIACIALFPFTIGAMSPYYVSVMSVVGIYLILAVSLDLLVGYTGQISLGHAAFFGIGAYTSGILTAKYGIAPPVALIASIGCSGAAAWLIGWPVLALRGYYLAMATFALTAIVYTLITVLRSLTGGATGLADIPSFSLLGIELESHISFYFFVWAIALLVILSCIAIVRSPLGRTLTAIHSDETAASMLGIHCSKYKVNIFVLSSVYAGVAGSLFAHYMGFLAPNDFGVLTSIHVLIMVYLGGVGTIYGPALGAAFLKIIPEVTYTFHDYEPLLNGLILIVVLVFVPKGIFGVLGNTWRRLFGKYGVP